jgi:hypothetical protein
MSPTALLLPKVKPSDRHWYAYDVEFDGVVIVSIDWAWLQGFCKAPGGRKRFPLARPFDRWGSSDMQNSNNNRTVFLSYNNHLSQKLRVFT